MEEISDVSCLWSNLTLHNSCCIKCLGLRELTGGHLARFPQDRDMDSWDPYDEGSV
jgi:hypothetical protein